MNVKVEIVKKIDKNRAIKNNLEQGKLFVSMTQNLEIRKGKGKTFDEKNVRLMNRRKPHY